MAEVSERSDEVNNFLENNFGMNTAIKNDICLVCKKPAKSFRDSLSAKEFSQSGLCQDCQDNVFGK